MADKQLTYNQQLALLPATIPDSILDFLEDFSYDTALQTEGARAAFDPDFLKAEGDQLKTNLESVRKNHGKPVKVEIEPGGRELPGSFMIKLGFASGTCGIAVHTKLKERTIIKLFVQEGEYSQDGLKQLLKGNA